MIRTSDFTFAKLSPNLARESTTIGMVCWTAGPTSIGLFMFLMGVFGLGMFPVCNAAVPYEAVPAGLTASAVGVIIFIGGVVGAAVVPALGGMLADARGLPATMVAGGICAIVAAIISTGLIETALKVPARRELTATAARCAFARF